MKYLYRLLGGLLMICLTVRVAAWLLEPVFPVIVGMALLAAISLAVFRDRTRL